MSPLQSEVYAGPRGGPFVRLTGAPTPCPQLEWFAKSVAVAGGAVAVSEELFGCHGYRRDGGGGPTRVVLFPGAKSEWVIERRASRASLANIRLAGHYIAWAEARPAGPLLVLYDLRVRRTVYQLRIGLAGAAPPAFDLQADGSIVVLRFADTRGSCPAQGNALYVVTPQRPALHPLGVRASAEEVRLVDDRFAFMRTQACQQSPLQLLIEPLGEPETVVAGPPVTPLSPRPEGFDYDGRRVAYAVTNPDVVTTSVFVASP